MTLPPGTAFIQTWFACVEGHECILCRRRVVDPSPSDQCFKCFEPVHPGEFVRMKMFDPHSTSNVCPRMGNTARAADIDRESGYMQTSSGLLVKEANCPPDCDCNE